MLHDGFLEHWLGVDGKTYLETHDGKVDFETILTELTARKPPRGDLLALAADGLRKSLAETKAMIR